jgi:heme/copper-type cytochrome/quinol oxidase subunit 2
MSFFNCIIKLTEFIELNQVYNTSLKFFIFLKTLALTKYFFFYIKQNLTRPTYRKPSLYSITLLANWIEIPVVLLMLLILLFVSIL